MGHKWRIRAYGDNELIELEKRGVFDELVVSNWFHLEQLDKKRWFIRVGDANIYVHYRNKDDVKVDILRGQSCPTNGTTEV